MLIYLQIDLRNMKWEKSRANKKTFALIGMAPMQGCKWIVLIDCKWKREKVGVVGWTRVKRWKMNGGVDTKRKGGRMGYQKRGDCFVVVFTKEL